MTRINLIDLKDRTDQHLFAEYREITRIFVQVQMVLAKYPATSVLTKIQPSYRLHGQVIDDQAYCHRLSRLAQNSADT